MMHMTFADKSFILGDEAARTVLKYAALLARNNNADTVTVNAIGADGDEVQAVMLLDAGAPVMAETSHSSQPEPDNTTALSYMNAQISRFLDTPNVTPEDAGELDHYDYSPD